MPGKRILLMYVSFQSGHHHASKAIEAALKLLDQTSEVLNIDFFNYTNPLLEKLIFQTYFRLIQTAPGVWDYVYDNPRVAKKIQRPLRHLIHRSKLAKLRLLLDSFQPHVVVCTQAFPCGVTAEYKRASKMNLPLVGILTDYAPHLYWLSELVDYYFVPTKEAGSMLAEKGIPLEKIKDFGIPIGPEFTHCQDQKRVRRGLGLDEALPTVLVMGGGRGMGPIGKIVRALQEINRDFQLLVVTGNNRRLKKELEKRQFRFSKRTRVFGYVNNVDELMEAASLIITKPGGLTTAESLGKELPIIIVSSLPGQEEKNTRFLLEKGVARKVENTVELKTFLEELLLNPDDLTRMQQAARRQARTDAALEAARFLLSL